MKEEAALFLKYGEKELLEALKNVSSCRFGISFRFILNSEHTEIEVPGDKYHHYKS
jgi:hypothetical protein